MTIWTAYEVVTLWAYANGLLPFINWETKPGVVRCPAAADPGDSRDPFLLRSSPAPLKPLYRSAHHLHHRNVNVGPWSGLSMHPVEHLLYFTGVLVHWVVASHPVHAVFHLMHAGLSPAPGHCGFERIAAKGGKSMKIGNYFHYLHHQHFECNYSGDGMPLFDKLFGTFHDGSDEAAARMNERRRLAQ